MKVSPKLLELTNKFISDFLETANEIEKKESLNPDKHKRFDSYHFNYTLADAITQTEHYVNNKNNNDDYGAILPMSSISSRLMENELNFRTKDLDSKIQILVDNYSKSTCDRSIIKLISDDILTKEFTSFDFNIIDDEMDAFNILKVNKDYRKVVLNLYNTTNLMNLELVVEFTPKGELYKMKVYSKKELIFSRKCNQYYENELIGEGESKIENITFIRDINGLFSAINNILFSIENPND
jgi:hypothetical protein